MCQDSRKSPPVSLDEEEFSCSAGTHFNLHVIEKLVLTAGKFRFISSELH